MSPTARQFGKGLRIVREDRGRSQTDLAKRAGLSRVFVNQLEAGRRDPSLSTVTRLAKALGVTLAELLAAGEGK